MALSLGKNRGVALVGRSLDMTVRVALDPGDDAQNMCPDVDIFYGDNRVDKALQQVSVSAIEGSSSEAQIRIRSQAAIDELVVSAYVRVGCSRKIERRYVMLVDLVPDAPVSQEPVVGAVAAVKAQIAASSTKAEKSKTSSTYKSEHKAKSKAEHASAKVVQDAAQPPAPVVSLDSNVPERTLHASRTLTKHQANLKLEPVDLPMEAEPKLKASEFLSVVPSLDAPRPPKIETDIERLQKEVKKNQSVIADLKVKLQKAQQARWATVVAYVLGGLLVMALAALVFVWRKASIAGRAPWWHSQRNQLNELVPDQVRGEPKVLRSEAFIESAYDELEPEPGLDDAPDSLLEEVVQSTLQPDDEPLPKIAIEKSEPKSAREPKPALDFSVGESPGMSRTVKAEELFDVQRQADFFVSLGQHEQAINVLRNHIVGDKAHISALAYIDLFNLYHQLDRRDDYETLRQDFNGLFNAQVPPFDLYETSGPGLEANQEILQAIINAWTLPEVPELIESHIFCQPGSDVHVFSLEAYRELLLLYAIAKDSELDASPVHAPVPVKAQVKPVTQNAELLPTQTMPKASPRMGLDIDLSEG